MVWREEMHDSASEERVEGVAGRGGMEGRVGYRSEMSDRTSPGGCEVDGGRRGAGLVGKGAVKLRLAT